MPGEIRNNREIKTGIIISKYVKKTPGLLKSEVFTGLLAPLCRQRTRSSSPIFRSLPIQLRY